MLNMPFPVQPNSGSWEVIQGSRTQRSQYCAPCEAGVSYSTDVSVDEVEV